MSREPDKITGLEEQQQCFICSKHLKHIFIENYKNYNNLENKGASF